TVRGTSCEMARCSSEMLALSVSNERCLVSIHSAVAGCERLPRPATTTRTAAGEFLAFDATSTAAPAQRTCRRPAAASRRAHVAGKVLGNRDVLEVSAALSHTGLGHARVSHTGARTREGRTREGR